MGRNGPYKVAFTYLILSRYCTDQRENTKKRLRALFCFWHLPSIDARFTHLRSFVAGPGIEPGSGGSFTHPVSRMNGLSHNPAKDSFIIVSEPSELHLHKAWLGC